VRLSLTRSQDDRIIAGVCGGIAAQAGVDATLVRLLFAILAPLQGFGILLYLTAWAALGWASSGLRRAATIALAVTAALMALTAIGYTDRRLTGSVLVAVGALLIWRRRSEAQTAGGLALVGVGSVALVIGGGTSPAPLSPAPVLAGLFLVTAPLVWRLVQEREGERAARIRSDERADVAARVHDSVLQTLTLIQRHADDPRRVASLARREERELRTWLYGGGSAGEGTLGAALARAGADVEELHGVRIELATGGDVELDGSMEPLVLAASEAMVNAAKFSGAQEIAVYAEGDDEQASVFVRDRGIGFDRTAVPADRHGLADSIEARMARAGGRAVISSTPGEGTEVELVLPRRPS
jgi:signal transduction histidine kinase